MEITKKIVVFIIITLIFLPVLPGSIIGDTPTTSSSARQDDVHDVRLYLHRDNIMDTEPPTGASQPISLSDGEEAEFVLTPALFDNLKVNGRQTHGTENGFWFDLQVRTTIVIDETSITIKVLDNQVLIAEDTTTLGANFEEDAWYISFTNPTKQDHTFNRDHTISVKINVTTSGSSLPVVITVDSGTDNGYLTLPCDQITSITTGAYHADDTAGEFYPNLPDTEYAEDRIIKFKGDIVDTFGAYDVELVEIEVVGETGLLTADYIDDGTDSGYYEHEWPYDQGISPGKKIYNVYVTDNSGYEYVRSDSFTMANYGVHIEATNSSKYGLPGDSVQYSFDVYNIGGSSDSFSLTAESSPSTWTPTLDTSNTGTVSPGGYVTRKLTVFIPTTAYENEKCTTTVTATSNNDSEPPLATATMDFVTVAQAIYSYTLTVNEKSDYIQPGSGTEFIFTITNDGDAEDTYDVFISWDGSQSAGWEYDIQIVSDGTYTEIDPDINYEVYLDSRDVAQVTLSVSVSVNPSQTEVEINLQVTSDNITDQGKVKTESVKVSTESGPSGELELTADITSRTANPGSSIDPTEMMDVYFDITVVNSDSLSAVNVTKMSVSSKSSGLQFQSDFSPQDSFSVNADDEFPIILTISLPEKTMYEADGYKFTVEAIYDGETASEEFTVNIEQLIDAKIETTVSSKTIDWQESAEYELKITNIGNVKDEKLEIMYTGLPDDWELILSKTSVKLGDFNSTETVSATVIPSEDVKADEEVAIEFTIETSNGKSIGDSLTVSISVEKDFYAELGNFFEEFWIILVFVIVIIIVTAVVYRRMK